MKLSYHHLVLVGAALLAAAPASAASTPTPAADGDDDPAEIADIPFVESPDDENQPNPNRFMVKGAKKKGKSIERGAKGLGGKMKGSLKRGDAVVVEFGRKDKVNAAKFKKRFLQDAEIDLPVYSDGCGFRGTAAATERRAAGQTTGGGGFDADVVGPSEMRRLQSTQQVPWGINNVFKDETGASVLPTPAYLPSDPAHPVCIIDSGYQLSNPDLPGDATAADSGQADDFDPKYFGVDGCEHGTHVAGTIAAKDNSEGVIGVFPGAPGLKIVKVFGVQGSTSCSWSYTSSLIAAANRCVDSGAKIISMSLGGSGYSSTTEDAFAAIMEEDVLVIAAAGNGGNSVKSYPASYSSIMSVGATDENDEIVYFSQYNDKVDISAPGWQTLSTENDGYGIKSGTSMATPHVAGVAALLRNSYPTCDQESIRDSMKKSAFDAGDPGRDDYYGHGIVRYWAAETYLQNNHVCGFTSPRPAVVCDSKISDHEGATGQQLTCTVSSGNNYTGTVDLSCPNSPAGVTCSSISPTTVTIADADSSETVTVSLNVDSAQDVGSYFLKVRAQDSTDSNLGHNSNVEIEVVPAFDVTCSPSSQSGREGITDAEVTCTAASNKGYTGTVTFACPDSEALDGLTCESFTPATATIPSDGTVSTTVALRVVAASSDDGSGAERGLGAYGVTVQAESTEGYAHDDDGISYEVTPAFEISCEPSTMRGLEGVDSSFSSTCTVRSLSSYVGTVDLSCNAAGESSAVTCDSVTPSQLTLSAGGTATAELAFSADPDHDVTSFERHDFTLEATSQGDNFVHSSDLAVTMTHPGSGPYQTELEPEYSGYSVRDGHMFDVEAFMDVILTGFTFRAYRDNGMTGEMNFEVYTKSGSYRGHEYDTSAWTFVGNHTLLNSGWCGLNTISASAFDPVLRTIRPDTNDGIQAFYVTLTSGSGNNWHKMCFGYSGPSGAYEAPHLDLVKRSSAMNYPFTQRQSNTHFMGGVTYDHVAPIPVTLSPTSSPTSSPVILGTSEYDETLGAPVCANVHSRCDSEELLDGRGTAGAGEPNAPNTLGNSCGDGNSGSYHGDESVDRIVVRSVDGGDLAELHEAEIEAHVWACNCRGDVDKADFYHTLSAENPTWEYIGTVEAPMGGAQVLRQRYTLPIGPKSMQAVRVDFSGGSPNTVSHCTEGEYSDTDDLAFAVVSVPSPTASPSSVPTGSPVTASPVTVSPSASPSSAPTGSPVTASPTNVPSLSASPSSSPTAAPITASPSRPDGFEVSLETNPWCNHSGGQAGVMFDIEAKRTITVTSFDFMTNNRGLLGAEIWTKAGSYVGSERTASDWTKIADVEEMQGLDWQTSPRTSSPMGPDIISQGIEAGETRAFYVTQKGTSGGSMVYEPTGQAGEVFNENDEIKQFVGIGGYHGFGYMFSNKKFNGVIHYRTGTDAPTYSPAPTISAAPSSSPTSTPSSNPSISMAPTTIGPYTTPEESCSSCYIRDGHMFDLHADKEVTVTQVKLRPYGGSGDLTAHVWTKAGSRTGSEYAEAEWTLVGNHTFSKPSGFCPLYAVPAADMTPVHVAAGTTQAFYVTLKGGNGDLCYKQVDATTGTSYDTKQVHLEKSGAAMNYKFKSKSSNSQFIGSVVYWLGDNTGDGASMSAASSQTETSEGRLVVAPGDGEGEETFVGTIMDEEGEDEEAEEQGLTDDADDMCLDMGQTCQHTDQCCSGICAGGSECRPAENGGMKKINGGTKKNNGGTKKNKRW